MSKIPVTDMNGAPCGEFELAAAALELQKGAQAVHDAVTAHLALRRAGSADTKGKGAVAGTGKKPWKQKGTGRARAGYRRSPVWRGGGVAHGPHPRDYGAPLPKKMARLALRRAFAERVNAGEVRGLEEIRLAAAKTKTVAALLKSLHAERGALLLTDAADPALRRAARNLPSVEVAAARQVNVYQLLRWPVVIATRAALAALQERLLAPVRRGE